MSTRPGFQILPHTADLRARLSAPDEAGLAQAAADFARTVLVGSSPVAATEQRRIAAEGEDPAERFFRFLRELFYLADATGFLPATVAGRGPWTVTGETLDPERHTVEHPVKALTRHGYAYRAGAGGYHVTLVLDL